MNYFLLTSAIMAIVSASQPQPLQTEAQPQQQQPLQQQQAPPKSTGFFNGLYQSIKNDPLARQVGKELKNDLVIATGAAIKEEIHGRPYGYDSRHGGYDRHGGYGGYNHPYNSYGSPHNSYTPYSPYPSSNTYASPYASSYSSPIYHQPFPTPNSTSYYPPLQTPYPYGNTLNPRQTAHCSCPTHLPYPNY